jgi:NAD(P)-dependent dehydrogenase (short-subunit alcohol dehydrogenase family)
LLGASRSRDKALYAASKWALEAATEILAQEVWRFGIRVALVEPGVIATPIFNKIPPREYAGFYPQRKRLLALFRTSLKNSAPASLVGDKIAEIVGTADTRPRHPVGPDAQGFLGWRASLNDEQWIERNGAESDEEWLCDVRLHLGMDVQLAETG